MTEPREPSEPHDEEQGSGDSDARDMQHGCVADAENDAETALQPRVLRSGVDAREAARLRWQKHREREAEEAAHDMKADDLDVSGVQLVRVTVKTGAIIKRLEADAIKGNTQAARELRAWRSELPIEADTDGSDLDSRMRQHLLAKLLAEIAEEDALDATHR